jgi:hypothetical protein
LRIQSDLLNFEPGNHRFKYLQLILNVYEINNIFLSVHNAVRHRRSSDASVIMDELTALCVMFLKLHEKAYSPFL